MDVDNTFDADSRNASCSSMETDWQLPKVEFQSGNQDHSVHKRLVFTQFYRVNIAL